jgi:hypothetical protein
MKLFSNSLSSSSAFAFVVAPRKLGTLMAATKTNATAPTHKNLRILCILLSIAYAWFILQAGRIATLGGAFDCFYSPGCLEEVFPET